MKRAVAESSAVIPGATAGIPAVVRADHAVAMDRACHGRRTRRGTHSLWMTVVGCTAALVISGCKAPEKLPATAPTTAVTAPPVAIDTTPQDAVKTTQQFFQLQIVQLAVPQGSISRNEVFWKPFDETFLGFEQHHMLYKNGIRVGRAPMRELAAIQGQLDDAERKNKELVGTQAKNVEMELRRGIERETLFSFNDRGLCEGHDFLNVDNLFVLGFRQVPRRPDRVFLSIVPAVRDTAQKLVMEEDSPKWIQPKTLYDVGINLELGLDECVVIAPSSVAVNNATTVGRLFMMEDRPASRVEIVLVVFPEIKRGVEEVKSIARPR